MTAIINLSAVNSGRFRYPLETPGPETDNSPKLFCYSLIKSKVFLLFFFSVFFVILVPYVGLFEGGIIYMGILSYSLGSRKWTEYVLIPLITIIVSYFSFVKLLGIPIPLNFLLEKFLN